MQTFNVNEVVDCGFLIGVYPLSHGEGTAGADGTADACQQLCQ